MKYFYCSALIVYVVFFMVAIMSLFPLPAFCHQCLQGFEWHLWPILQLNTIITEFSCSSVSLCNRSQFPDEVTATASWSVLCLWAKRGHFAICFHCYKFYYLKILSCWVQILLFFDCLRWISRASRVVFNTVVAELVLLRILNIFHLPGGISYMAASAQDLCVVVPIGAIVLSCSCLLWLTVDMSMIQQICTLLDQGVWFYSYCSGLNALYSILAHIYIKLNAD